MHSDEELDESKFVPDYNEDMTPSQSSQDEVLSSITSSIYSMDLLVVDEVRCSSDEVEDQVTGVDIPNDGHVEQPTQSAPQLRSQGAASYHCPLCGTSLSGHVKRHVQRVHLPSFLSGNCTVENPPVLPDVRSSGTMGMLSFVGQPEDQNLHDWCHLVNGSLHLLRQWIGVSTLEQLLDFVVGHSLYPSVGQFTAAEVQLMSFYAMNYSSHLPAKFETSPPNHVICLTHWQILCTFLRQFPKDRHAEFQTWRRPCDHSGCSIQDNPVIDSHFHLDQLFARGIANNCNEILSIPSHLSQYHLIYAVANYVFPKHWSLWKSQVDNDSRLRVTFGIHPHLAGQVTTDMLEELRKLAYTPECVAIGEIGIDMTTKCDCKEPCSKSSCRRKILHHQMELLADLLVLAIDTRKPVVLHCRDDGTSEAAHHTLSTIQMMNMGNHVFHYHCFTGSVAEAKEWVRNIPAIVFGISPKAVRDVTQREVIEHLDLQRIVLETDSPYLADGPWDIIAVAEEVANIKGCPLQEVLRYSRDNAARVYGPQ